MSQFHQRLNQVLTPLIQAVQEDAQFYIELWRPYVDIHIIIIMVHRLLEDIPVTSYRMSVQLGVPEECSGVVCSADREAEGALHFRQKALNMKGNLAYLTETKFQAVRATHLCQMTDAKGILWVDNGFNIYQGHGASISTRREPPNVGVYIYI